jgi:hypothetical protein
LWNGWECGIHGCERTKIKRIINASQPNSVSPLLFFLQDLHLPTFSD